MAIVTTDNKYYYAIAQEIRDRTGTDDEYSPVQMPGGIEKVYDAGYNEGEANGKASMIDESKIIEKTVTGKVISVDDVSEIPHEVAIQLSSDTVTNFSNVKVRICGKNLMSVQPRSVLASAFEECYFLPKGTYTVCMDVAGASGWRYTYKLYDKNGNAITETSDKATHLTAPTQFGVFYNVSQGRYLWATERTYKQAPFTIDDDYYVGINYYIPTSGAIVTNGHIELGENFNAQYEPYEERIGIVNADGTVEGITSIAPNMTVVTNNANVKINMDYHMSYGAWLEWNRYWDTQQNYGLRTNYLCGLGGEGWTESNFDPKYSMKVSNGYMMFRNSRINADLVEIFARRGNTITFNDSWSMQYTFQNSQFTHIGVVECNNVPLIDIFDGCTKLVTIDGVSYNTSQSINSNNYRNCSELVNLTIIGTIAKNGFNLQWSTKLSKASFINVFEHTSTTATITVTFSQTAVISAFGSTDSPEWTNLVASRPNATIALA